MMTQNADKKRDQIQMFCMEDLIPEDHLLRLPSLDPYAIQFALSCIRYIRENPNYLDTINDNQKVLRK